MFKKIVFLVALLALPLFAQNSAIKIGVKPFYSVPVGGLSEWFKPSVGLEVSVTQSTETAWHMEYSIGYVRFDDENLDAQRKERVDLFLEHVGFTVNGLYPLSHFGPLELRLNLGGGLYYWKGIRGAVSAEPNANPPIPPIDERRLEEWNWGLKTGLSVRYRLESLEIEPALFYRLVIGELWPTLQPGVELENVSGLQTINIGLGLRYTF